MATLDAATAKQFFANLYEEIPTLPDTPNFDKMATRLVTRLGPNVSSGDQALQALMFNYILSDPARASASKDLASVLGNIKQVSLVEFAKRFPNADLTALLDAARQEGYDVEIL